MSSGGLLLKLIESSEAAKIPLVFPPPLNLKNIIPGYIPLNDISIFPFFVDPGISSCPPGLIIANY